MPAKLPYDQWYWADWFRDTRRLSIATKGFWIDVIGHLRQETKTGWATYDLATWGTLTNCTESDAEMALTELGKWRIATIVRKSDGQVTVSCRRVVREKRERKYATLRQERYRQHQIGDATVDGAVTAMSRPSDRPKQKQRQKQRTEAETEAEKEREEKTVSLNGKKSSRSAAVPDDEWLATLKTDPTYAGLDIDRLAGKCRNWCREHGKVFSRKRVINWLNREDRPLEVPHGAPTPSPARDFRAGW